MSLPGLKTDTVLEVENSQGVMEPIPKEIDQTIIATGLTLTTEGSSTVTITARDPAHMLQKAGFFERHAEAVIDKTHPFVACAFKKKVDEYTLEFEDRDFNLLKEGPGSALKVAVQRTHHMTLARFVKTQCKRLCPHAGFICPQLDEQQPREAEKSSKTVKTPEKGIAKGSMTIAGQPATADQEKVAEELLGVVAELKGHNTVAVAIIYAALGETKLGADAGTYSPNEANCSGVLQEKEAPNPHDTKGMARRFCLGSSRFQAGGAIHLSKTVTNPEQIAVEVEVPSIWPANAYAAEGGDLLGDAEGIVKAYGGVSGSSPTKTTTVFEPLVFELNSKIGTSEEGGEEEGQENALEGIEALLKPGKWQFYKIGNDFYLMTEEYMKKLRPVVTLAENTKGILDIGWDLDYNEKKKTWEVEIECRAELWAGHQGEVIAFAKSVGKEISGKKGWFVQTIERKDITDNATAIKLILPEAGKPEKADGEKQVTSSVAAKPGGSPGQQQIHQSGPKAGKLKGSSLAWKIYEQCKWIDEQHYAYFYGGGHSSYGPNKEIHPPGLDCSGAVSWPLHEAGLLPGPPQDTEELEKWGQGGEGKYITLYVRNSGGQEHCYLDINIPQDLRPDGGEGDVQFVFEASHTGATEPAPYGVGLRPRYKPPDIPDFNARHWPGI